MKQNRQSVLLGLGLDNRDGHKRITRGDDFCLVGGSEETHEKMVETTLRFHEKLDRKGKVLADLSREEFRDMMQEAAEK